MGYQRHSAETRQRILNEVKSGVPVLRIAKRENISRSTINSWRKGGQTREEQSHSAGLMDLAPVAQLVEATISKVVQCEFESHQEYNYLLGVYLGDGYIDRMPRTYRLRFFQDGKYPILTQRWADTLGWLLPQNTVSVAKRGAMNIVMVHSQFLPALFPQHGEGRKHERKIALVEWQERALENPANTRSLVEGAIHSDGCIYNNRVNETDYKSYDFANTSQDILDIVERASSTLGLRCTRGKTNLRWRKRSDVEVLDGFVQPKA